MARLLLHPRRLTPRMRPAAATLRRRRPADHGADGPRVLPWPDHLDALEEWLRRGRALFAGTDGVVDLPPLVCVPDGALPPELRLRAAADLQELERLQAVVERRLHEAQRGAAYSRY